MLAYFFKHVLEITSHPQSKQALVGSTVNLTCTASVSSNVKFLWMHNGKKLQYNERRVFTSTGDTSTLMITRVKCSDAGDYVCEAIARGGSLSSMSAIATLTVNKP